MRTLKKLFENNRDWGARIRAQDADFFRKLSEQQSPEYLWIGCSDSRVPANQIVGLLPGEVFVHRNIANVVVHADLNALSVIQFAVDVLRVKHIIVCGHYGCSGVRAACEGTRIGLADNWLRHVQDVADKYGGEIGVGSDESERIDRLCELNVIEQVANVCRTTIVQDAWARGQPVEVHGWIYGVGDGMLRDLGFCAASPAEFETVYRIAPSLRARSLPPAG